MTVAQLEEALLKKQKEGGSYKIVTVTHVDTSTGVLANIKEIAQAVRRISPSSLVSAISPPRAMHDSLRYYLFTPVPDYLL